MKNAKLKSFLGIITLIVLLASCSKEDSPEKKVVLSSEKQLTNFTFSATDNATFSQDVTTTINEGTKLITATLPSDTDVTALSPTLAVSTKASVSPTGVQDFTNPITYTVTAEDGTKATYTATFVSNSSAKQITSFVFLAADNETFNSTTSLNINEATKEISKELKGFPDLTELSPTLVVSDKASVSPTGTQDFTNPVAYTITAEDGSETIYTVTVTKNLTQKEILQTIVDANPNNTLGWDLVNTADLDLGTLDGVTTNSEGNIIELNLESVNLVKIPTEIKSLQVLTALRLIGNNIDEIPKEIGNLANLITLSLENNNLTTLPPEIGNLNNLIFLDINTNKLISMPIELTNLIALEDLYLSHNQLKTLPNEIGNLVNLLDLQLGDNQLQSIPVEVGNLKKLFRIILRNNQLGALPAELGFLNKLTSLIITGNSFSSIPRAVCNLSEFNNLNLQKDVTVSCETTSPKDALIGIYSANPNNTLDWSMGNFSGVTFGGQQSITEIDLRDKGIERIEQSVATFEFLELLDVRDNPLASIHNDVCTLTFTTDLTILVDTGEGCN
ncbi:MAG: hypothetical protein V3U92_17260 [Cellulophaga sp.]